MAEQLSKFEVVLENQDDATKQKLSSLQEKIADHISSAPLEKLENSISGKAATSGSLNIHELLSSFYAQRMSKDILMHHLTGAKNQKLGFFDRLRQSAEEKVLDMFMKQQNSYDSVLTNRIEAVKTQFKAELDELKQSVKVGIEAKGKKKEAQETIAGEHEGFAETSHYTEEEKTQINAVIVSAQKFAGTIYQYGGNTDKGIDCSGLRSKAIGEHYKDAGETFGRLTAALFDKNAPDIARSDVERGDRMFWEDPEGVRKGGKNENGEKIYHIEMALGKPFEKDGKRYVKTYGSGSEKNVLDEAGKNTGKNGVGYRIREIKSNHHFAKPPYYTKLVAMKGGQQERASVA